MIRFERGNSPGTPIWWLQHIIWRVTRLCYHGRARKNAATAGIDISRWRIWVWRGGGCRDANLAEYGSLLSSRWGEARVFENSKEFLEWLNEEKDD